MRSYLQNVRQSAVGQGIVCEFPMDPPNQTAFTHQTAWGLPSPPGRAQPGMGAAAGAGQWAGAARPLLMGGEPTYYASLVTSGPQQPQLPPPAAAAYPHSAQTYLAQGTAGGSGVVSGLLPASSAWPGDPLDGRLSELGVTNRGVQPSGSFVASAEATRRSGLPLAGSAWTPGRRPFRSVGGLSNVSCRSAVTVTGDQPFRGIQDLTSDESPRLRQRAASWAEPGSGRSPPPAARSAATSSYDLGSVASAPAMVPSLRLGQLQQQSVATVAPAERPPAPAWDARRRWCCHQCRAPMRPGDLAVFAERAGANKCWHPQCFVCATCQELLVDLIYFFKSGQVFCGRHYAERLNLSRCPGCDELIFSHQYTEAGGRRWHTGHFVCAACSRPLAALQYVMREDRPHCIQCYQRRHGKTCVTCSRPIAPSSRRVSLADRQFWHADADCFHCFTCRAGLIDTSFICGNGKVFCSAACATVL